MRFIFPVVLLFLGLSAFFSCGSRPSSHPILMRIDSLVEKHPDSALTMLYSLSDVSEMSHADRAYYAILLAVAMDKSDLPLLPCDSLLNDALHYYGDADKEKALALLYKGRLLAQMDDKKTAIELNLKALEVLRHYPKERNCRRLIYSALGLWYVDNGLYDKASEVLNQSLAYSDNKKDSSIAYSNFCNIYLLKEESSKAVYYARKAVEYAKQSSDSILMIALWYNLSSLYAAYEKRDSAMLLARKVIQWASPHLKSYARYCYHMADLYIDVEDYDSARYYLEECKLDADMAHLRCWSLACLEAEQGNFETAYHCLDTYVTIGDSLRSRERISEIQHMVYRHQTEMEVRLEKEKTHFRVGIIIFVCLIVVFVLVFIFQYRIGIKDKREALYQQSLKYAKDKLVGMQRYIDENEILISSLKSKETTYNEEIVRREQLILQLKKEKFALRTWLFEQTAICKKIQMLSKQEVSNKKELKVLTDAEHKVLRKTIFDIFEDYVSPLKENYPRLTDEDLLLLCLQEMKLPSLTIAMCYGYSDTSTINQRKSRLKTKMS